METWWQWLGWRLFLLLLTKAVALTLLRICFARKQKAKEAGLDDAKKKKKEEEDRKEAQQLKRNWIAELRKVQEGIWIGVVSGIILQIWNVAEVYVKNADSVPLTVVFYLLTVIFILLTVRESEWRDDQQALDDETDGSRAAAKAHHRDVARPAVVTASLFNILSKAPVQNFARRMF